MTAKLLKLLPLLLALLVPPSLHADYEEGLNAAFAGDFETALREFTIEAENGLDLAQYNLAILYFTGRGVERDLERAFHWTEQAALQGHIEAQANLGSLYFEGDGVERDLEQAAAWFGQAAKTGHASTAFALATMYFEGDPLERDLVQAHAWASQAIRNEHEQADLLRRRIEDRLSKEQLRAARRLFARWQIE